MIPALREALRGAARRAAGRDARGIARAAVVVAVLWCAGALVVAFAGPSAWAGPARVAAAVAVGACIAAPFAAFVRHRDSRSLARLLDRELSLPDSALAALEISPQAVPPAWTDAITTDFLKRHRQAVVPVEANRAGFPALALALLVVAVAVWVPRPPGPPVTDPADAPWIAPAEADILPGDWQRYVQERSGPAAEAVRRALDPLRAGLRETSRDEALVKIGHADDILRKAESALPATDPGALADPSGSDPILEAVAAGDASRALAAVEEALGDAPSAETAARLARIASRLDRAGFSKAAEALRALAGAGASRAGALDALDAALGAGAEARLARADLGLARMQLAALRETSGQSPASGGVDPVPRLSGKDSGAPGTGAGADASPLTGDASAARDPLSVLLPVTGSSAGEGESTVTVLPTASGPATKPSTPATDSVTMPGMLSSDAVPDENLPPAHRTTIRKYFQTLRSQIQ
jgi:hypothetical protein